MTTITDTGSRLIHNNLRRIIPFGDSITASTSSVSPNGLWSQSTGYAESSIRSAGPKYTFVRNAGIAGNTTTQMLARIQSDVIAYAPDICLLLGGTNDIASGMTNAQMLTMMNNLEKMVLQLLAANIMPVIVTPPPKNAAVTESKQVQPLYYMLAEFYHLPLIDMYRICVDPATGNYLTGYSPDGTHPGPVAIQAIEVGGAAVLSNVSSYFTPPYLAAVSESAAGNQSNLIQNGAFAIQTVPGTPDSWAKFTSFCSYSIASAAQPFTGSAWDITSTTAGTYGTTGTTVTTGYSANDTLVFSGRATVTGLVPATANGFNLGLEMSSDHMRPLNGQLTNGTFDFSEEFTMPSNQVSGGMQPTLYLIDNSVSVTLQNLTLWNKTVYQGIWKPGQLLRS